MNRLTRWINKVTSPEGCTAVDARQLRKFNHDLAIEADRHKQELEALLNAQLEYGNCASMNHPRLTRAILRAKKHLGEVQTPETDESETQWADHYHKKLVEAREKGYLPEDFTF